MRQTFSFATAPICCWNKTYMHSTSISLTVSWQLFCIKYSKSQFLLHILFRYFMPPTCMLAILLLLSLLLFFSEKHHMYFVGIFVDFALWNNAHGKKQLSEASIIWRVRLLKTANLNLASVELFFNYQVWRPFCAHSIVFNKHEGTHN